MASSVAGPIVTQCRCDRCQALALAQSAWKAGDGSILLIVKGVGSST
jgi:hypothetical protein